MRATDHRELLLTPCASREAPYSWLTRVFPHLRKSGVSILVFVILIVIIIPLLPLPFRLCFGRGFCLHLLLSFRRFTLLRGSGFLLAVVKVIRSVLGLLEKESVDRRWKVGGHLLRPHWVVHYLHLLPPHPELRYSDLQQVGRPHGYALAWRL